MKPIEVRNIKIGEGIPKICVPIVEKTKESILAEAENVRTLPVDVVEWRVDWYEDVFNIEKVLDTVQSLRKVLGEIPLLFTFRTAKEGGERDISDVDYEALNLALISSGYIDLVDVEAFTGEALVKHLICAAHEAGVKVVASNHDFDGTPDKEEIVRRLTYMKELGADIPKIAVMPQTKEDVLVLLSATVKMREKYVDCPIITMSMSQDGMISRLCGEAFGSVLTFGASKKASAPGQIGVLELKEVLDVLHKNMVGV